MANLSNCIVTQYGPALEQPGDSIPLQNTQSGPGQLELQKTDELIAIFGEDNWQNILGLFGTEEIGPFSWVTDPSSGEQLRHGHYWLKI